jgi:hypothetical protein
MEMFRCPIYFVLLSILLISGVLYLQRNEILSDPSKFDAKVKEIAQVFSAAILHCDDGKVPSLTVNSGIIPDSIMPAVMLAIEKEYAISPPFAPRAACSFFIVLQLHIFSSCMLRSKPEITALLEKYSHVFIQLANAGAPHNSSRSSSSTESGSKADVPRDHKAASLGKKRKADDDISDGSSEKDSPDSGKSGRDDKKHSPSATAQILELAAVLFVFQFSALLPISLLVLVSSFCFRGGAFIAIVASFATLFCRLPRLSARKWAIRSLQLWPRTHRRRSSRR